MSKETSKAAQIKAPKKTPKKVAKVPLKSPDPVEEISDTTPKSTGWGPVSGVIWTAVIFGLGYISGPTVLFIYTSIRFSNANQAQAWFNGSALAQFIYVLVVETVMILALWAVLRYKNKSFKDIGLTKPQWKDSLFALSAYGVYYVVFAIIASIVATTVHSFNLNQQQSLGLQSSPHGTDLIYVFLSLAVLPPIAEELIFRGFLYGSLRRALPMIQAGLITSILFAAPHLAESASGGIFWIGGLDTFVLSAVSVFVREKTGRIYASMGLHAIKNTVAFMAVYVFVQTVR